MARATSEREPPRASGRGAVGYAVLDGLGLALMALLRALPLRAALLLGESCGGLASVLARRKRAAIRENYRRGGLAGAEQAPARVGRELGRTFGEMLWLLGRPPERSFERADVAGLEQLQRAADEGRGVLLATAHLANWEQVGLAATRAGVPVAVVARPLGGRGLERRIHRLRAAAGVRTLMRGQPGASVTASRWLLRGGILACMMDRSSSGRRVAVPFLGRATNVPLGPAILASRAGAAIVVASARRGADGRTTVRFRRLAVEPGTPPVELVLSIGRALEQEVRASPEQWYWISRRLPEWTGVPVIAGEDRSSPGDGSRPASLPPPAA